MKYFFAVLIALALFLPLSAQQKDEKKTEPKKEEKKEEKKPADDKPKPLFEGKSGFKSSRQTREEAAAAFNGVDEDGKVLKGKLNESPSSADSANAQSLVAYKPSESDLATFVTEGNLKPPAPKAAEQKK
jgi:hypothetical protein